LNNPNNIIVAKNAGFCFGVKRAVSMMEDSIDKYDKKIYCIGEIIHNKIVTHSFEELGVTFITRDIIDDLPIDDSLVFIRAHGEKKCVLDKLNSRGIRYIDATCPYVKKIHSIVSEHTDNETLCIVVGDNNHPEVEAINSFCNGDTLVVKDQFELKNSICDLDYKKIILVSQTTHSIDDWERCKEIALSLTGCSIFDTVCNVTDNRQKEINALSQNSDLVVVVGSKHSANTRALYQTASNNCSSILIEDKNDISKYLDLIIKSKKISLTAGASTPDNIIQEVIFAMTEIINENLSFAELLDGAFKTLHTGERVTGIVSMVSPAEIHVDLGTKHTGILPYDEVTDDSSVNLVNEFHVGDSIEVFVVKFNDSEGTALLSKKRVDAIKNWATVNEALENNALLTGKVKEVVKGGVILMYSGVRVFVPASQCGVGKDGDVSVLAGQEVPFKIIEVNQFKKRVIGSIKQAKRILHKEEVAKFFETAEEGQKFTGVVRSLTTYGVFVDIGGVDGMVHISELSWGRLKKPEDVVKVGDTMEVFIKSIDKEKRRISLGYKTEEMNPWNRFISQYNVGDVAEVKIVNVLPFGAFAEVINDVDGLIHISQISKKTVTNIKDFLNIGDVVKAKITNINEEDKKISLSIKAAEAEEIAKAEETVDAE